MAKSLVEKYEQILAQDPASTAFVELAKALLEKGDNERALEVCRSGLEHHADSVVGRVLYGKALINLGRPAEAMAQFDEAIALDRNNPHAYNLIGEVLLHKGLYRSALPLLKKAVALQPNDGRVKQWLEQTHAALAGGPAPILGDLTQVALSEAPPSPPPEEDRDRTEVGIPAYVPAPPTTPTDLPAVVASPDQGQEQDPWQVQSLEQVLVPSQDPDGARDPDVEPAQPQSQGESQVEVDPFAAVPKRTQTSEVIGGLTATFDALANPDPFAAVVDRSPPPVGDVDDRTDTALLQVPAPVGDPVSEPNIAVSEELYREGAVEHHAPASAASKSAPRGGGLLGDLPELPEPMSSLEVPRVEVSAQAAEAIAREYERELREKLAQSKAQKSFLSRNWIKLAASGVVALVVIVGAVVYWQTLSVNQGSLADALAEAKKGLAEDTRASYTSALVALARATRMDEESAEAWALTARAHATLHAEHGAREEDRTAARTALARPGVREAFPGIALVVDFALAEAKDRPAKVETILSAPAHEPDLHELAGQLLLEKGEEKAARTRLQQALELQPAHVRALVAVGEYFRRSGDYTNALEFYGRAAKVSPDHPGTILGAAESRLAMSQDLDTALTEVSRLPNDELLPEALRPRRVLVRGKLLAATGRPADAIELLREGAARYRLQKFEFQLALGDAYRKAGRMKEAEGAFDAALDLRPKDEDARESLAGVLVDRGQAREALGRVDADPKSRRISLVRGKAYARLGDWKRARTELERTQLEGKYPSEAVVLLALADANDGQELRAREVLEKILSVTKKARGDVLVALGEIHLRKGEVDKARARFEAAAKEGDESEGACAWGRMLVEAGSPEKALEPLLRAVAQNDSHDEAHEALARAYLQLGRVPDALKLTTRWQQTNKDSAAARRMHAWALFQSGSLKEADAAAWQSIREDSKHPETWRIRAMINFAQGDTRTGFSALEKANKLDSKDPETFCAIARAFLRQGNPEHAGAAFGAALREKVDTVCGRLGLLWVKLPSASRSSVKEAEQLGREAVSAWDKSLAHATVARMMLATGQAKEARGRADEAIKLASWSGDAHLARALVAEKLRDRAAAKEGFARAVELDPAHSGYRLEYADALARGDDEDQQKAVEEYERFLRLGGSERDEARVKRTLASLKRRLAAR